MTATVTLTDPTGAPIRSRSPPSTAATTTAQAASGTAYSLPLSDQVSYLTYPAGDTLSVGPTEAYGTDLASAAAGATATASSGNASAAIAGLTVGYGQGWTSAAGDTTPSLTVNLAARIDPRPGHRRHPVGRLDGHQHPRLHPVGRRAGHRMGHRRHRDRPVPGPRGPLHLLRPWWPPHFEINVSEVNFGGYYGGGIPPWWPATQGATPSSTPSRPTAGSGGPSVVDGTALPALARR